MVAHDYYGGAVFVGAFDDLFGGVAEHVFDGEGGLFPPDEWILTRSQEYIDENHCFLKRRHWYFAGIGGKRSVKTVVEDSCFPGWDRDSIIGIVGHIQQRCNQLHICLPVDCSSKGGE